MKRSALVTGGNRGIGFAIAEGLAHSGLDVIIASRSEQSGAEAAAKLGVRSVQLDLSDIESLPPIVEGLGAVDVLVNNAGVLGSGSLFGPDALFEESIDAMVRGPYHLMRLMVPHMSAAQYGRIVNVSSGWGAFSDGVAGPGAYGVAKAALNAMTVAAARGLPDYVKVNAMCPGWVRTRMGGAGADRSPEEGADTAVWLATLPEDGPTGGFFRDRAAIEW